MEMEIFRIESGQELLTALEKYCSNHGLEAGWVVVIGALSQATLAHFNPQTKKYAEKIIKSQLEIATVSGPISLCRGKIHFHLHAVLGNNQFQTFSGHFKTGIINPTAEAAIIPIKQKLYRTQDKKSGLDLLQ